MLPWISRLSESGNQTNWSRESLEETFHYVDRVGVRVRLISKELIVQPANICSNRGNICKLNFSIVGTRELIKFLCLMSKNSSLKLFILQVMANLIHYITK